MLDVHILDFRLLDREAIRLELRQIRRRGSNGGVVASVHDAWDIAVDIAAVRRRVGTCAQGRDSI